MSDFHQGKPIRSDRGMMILDHHHSGDNAPPTSPGCTLIHQTAQNTQQLPPHTHTLPPHLPPPPFLDSSPSPSPLSSPPSLVRSFLIFFVLCLSCLSFSLLPAHRRRSPSPPGRQTRGTDPALFLAHETFNISFPILADAGKK